MLQIKVIVYIYMVRKEINWLHRFYLKRDMYRGFDDLWLRENDL